MKIFASLVLALLAPLLVNANQEDFDTTEFAKYYFDAWSATQQPEAGKDDIEQYLSLLTENVGHQHLPYDPDADRDSDGKSKMREGMNYYLGAHIEYTSRLTDVMPGFNVIVIKYNTYAKGKHPQTGEIMELSFDTVEVLELENGKVSVIRKYSE